MAVTKNQIDSKGKSLVFSVDGIIKNINSGNIGELFEMFKNHVGDYKLDAEEKEQLKTIMNADALEAAKWKTVSDIFNNFISPAALMAEHPEKAKKIASIVLNKLAFIHPACAIAGNSILKVPDEIANPLLKVGALLAPDYLIYFGLSKIADKKVDKATRTAESESNVDQNLTKLIIVSKSKLLSSEIDKLINTKDDIDEENQVGTKDGTIHTIIWNEAAWDAFRQDLPENVKVLLIGNIKDSPNITFRETKFEEFGVKYGWVNNIAKIQADPSFLSKKSTYNDFLSALKKFQMPKKAKNNAKFKFDLFTVGKLAIFPPILLADAFLERGKLTEQQLLFGLHNIYLNDLSTFLNEEN